MLLTPCVRMLTVLTMLTMIYLFENTSSDREQGIINYSSIEESYHRWLALLSGDPWSPSASTSSRPRKRERNSLTFADCVSGTDASAWNGRRTPIAGSAETAANSAWNAASRLLPSASSASNCAKR